MKRNKGTFWRRTRGGELLESRRMFAAHPIAALGITNLVHIGGGLRAALLGDQIAGRLNRGSNSSGTALTATLTDTSGGTGSGTVTYATSTSHNGNTENSLYVSVTGEATSTTLTVAIGGVTVGLLTTDSTGARHIETV